MKVAETMVSLIDGALLEEVVAESEDGSKRVIYEPKGIVLALLTSDFPILNIINCVVPAILGGNSILLKDCTKTPFCSSFFEKAVEEIAPNVIQRFFMMPQEVQGLYSEQLI